MGLGKIGSRRSYASLASRPSRANAFLRDCYIAGFNAKFSVPAAQRGTAFRKCARADLDDVFSIQTERVVGKDNTVAIGDRYWQLDKTRFRRTLQSPSVSIWTERYRCAGDRHVVGRFDGDGLAISAKPKRGGKRREPGSRWKPQTGSHRFPPSLGNLTNQARFPLFHRADDNGCTLSATEPRPICGYGGPPVPPRHTVVNQADIDRLRDLPAQPPSYVSADQARLWLEYRDYVNRRLNNLQAELDRTGTMQSDRPRTFESYVAEYGRGPRRFEMDATADYERRYAGNADTRVYRQVALQTQPGRGHSFNSRPDVLIHNDPTGAFTARSGTVTAVGIRSHNWSDLAAKGRLDAMVRRDVNGDVNQYTGNVQVRWAAHPLFNQNIRVNRIEVVYNRDLMNGINAADTQRRITDLVQDTVRSRLQGCR